MQVGFIVAKRLREARERAGLSQLALGIGAGLDPSVAGVRVNQYERGRHLPRLRTVEQFARYLALPVPFFFTEDEQLAAWILAFAHVTPAVRREIAQYGRMEAVSPRKSLRRS